jgi:GT2 family glycosyltransferase
MLGGLIKDIVKNRRTPTVDVIEIVSATRMSEAEFWQTSALGQSIRRIAEEDSRLRAYISFENRRGLPEIYNAHINASSGDPIQVFMHDDVWITDYFFADRLVEAFNTYDVVGVAGNRRILPNQPSWICADETMKWDEKSNLSGGVSHGQDPFGAVSIFGTTPAECELLDGVFLAARRSSLVKSKVQFDPRFDFHFYDLDFCRTARKNGLRLGTWPICLTHQGTGVMGFSNPHWTEIYRAYKEKWGS